MSLMLNEKEFTASFTGTLEQYQRADGFETCSESFGILNSNQAASSLGERQQQRRHEVQDSTMSVVNFGATLVTNLIFLITFVVLVGFSVWQLGNMFLTQITEVSPFEILRTFVR